MSDQTYDPYDPIEGISSAKKQNPYDKWANLHDLNHYLDEVQSLDIEDIILQVCAKDRGFQLGRKYLHVDSRALTQLMQGELSEEKAKLLKNTSTMYLEATNMACQVLALKFGQGFATIGQACSASSTHFDRIARSKEETLNHHAQCKSNLHNDQTQQTRTAEEQLKQTHDLLDRINQSTRRLAEMVVGG